MGKKLLTLALALISIITFGQTRPGSLRGTVTDAGTGETIPFANVTIKDEAGALVAGGTTDFDGKFNINPVTPGTYRVECSFTGMAKITQTGVIVSPNSPTLLNFKLKEESTVIGEVVIPYEPPLIDKTKSSKVTTSEDIVNMAVRDITSVASQAAGVTTDANGNTQIRGARSEGTVYFIDGVKVRGDLSLPQAAIAQTEVITGGLPAQYGDALGGVISTTTRGPSSQYFGNAEFLTSAPFDDADYNLAAFTLGGPLFKNWKNERSQNIVGFLFSSEFLYQVEPRPVSSDLPYIQLNADTLASLQARPVQINASGTSVINRAELIDERSLSDISARPNSWNNELRLNGNVQVRTGLYTTLTLGGRFNYSNDKLTNYLSHVFNYENNRDNIRTDWTAFLRFQQQFPTGDDKNSLIKNAFYMIQMDYTRNSSESFDRRYGDDFFKYGYTGQYDVRSERAYAYGTDTTSGLPGWRFVGLRDTAVVYTPSNINRTLTNYVSTYYDLADEFQNLDTRTINDLLGNGLPVNGNNPSSVYGLWTNVGAIQGGYGKSRNSQFRVTASTNFDIKDHSLIVGFEYEQRSDRSYSLAAAGLWNQMRLLQNLPNQQLDLANPMPVYDDQGVFQDTIEYNFLYSANDASQFSESVRRALGLDPFGTDQINIDNLDPELFSLDMFSADELVSPNARYVSYFGYDYTGRILDQQPTINDFFTETDGNGRFTRPIGAFQPIYIAGYIQDQFTFNDLTFNVGVRVDRFDLNQSVLRDPYILYPYYTVSDLAASPIADRVGNIPAGVGGDYAVYVNSFDYNSSSLQIVGFRSGDNWFDADGQPLADPADLAEAAGGGIKPFLIDPSASTSSDDDQVVRGLPAESFKDYDPQTVVMPRIAFNFPITDEALFIAHYDLLAQRPSQGISRLNPFNYLDLANRQNPGVIANPDLLPQKTTEYELGFKQALTDKSALKISAFYRELRDLLQAVNFAEAFPLAYVAYGNRDFGTVKGFTLEYELRRTNNIKLDANYTLQFADGTGSSANSGVNLAQNGQPNLRYILPLDYDNRHQITVRLDFRYSSGPNYNGPVWWNSRVLENFGINITCNALSGRPFTKRDNPFPLTSSASASAQVEGQINGSRLPWQVTFDARINKIFRFKKGSRSTFEVYLQILNLLDTRNIVNVYPFTGSPDDDGYLVSPEAQSQLSSQTDAQSYIDLYNRRLVSPFNFSLPRRLRLGVAYNF